MHQLILFWNSIQVSGIVVGVCVCVLSVCMCIWQFVGILIFAR